MVRRLTLAISLLLPAAAKAQDFQGEVNRIVDSLQRYAPQYAWDDSASGSLGYERLNDSVTLALVATHVNAIVAEGKFTWPYWYFSRQERHRALPDSVVNLPQSPTGAYLLWDRYRISMNRVSNGCLWQQTFEVHDSLMMEAIRRRYGQDFFPRAVQEQRELDRRGRGLIMPFIDSPAHTVDTLRKLAAGYPNLQDSTGHLSKELFLLVRFEDGKIEQAYWGEYFLSWIQYSTKLNNPDNDPANILNSLAWTLPRFDGKSASATFLFRLDEGRTELHSVP